MSDTDLTTGALPQDPETDIVTGIDLEDDPTPPRPQVLTLGDSIEGLADTVVRLRKDKHLTEGAAVKIIDLALTFHIANRQLSQANPFTQFAPEAPTDD